MKKVLVVDLWLSSLIKEELEFLENDNLKFEIKRSRNMKKIPRGYDAYILHFSEIDKDDLITLRKEQPWSWIYLNSNAISSYDPKRIELLNLKDKLDVDGIYISRSPLDNIECIKEEIKNYRTGRLK